MRVVKKPKNCPGKVFKNGKKRGTKFLKNSYNTYPMSRDKWKKNRLFFELHHPNYPAMNLSLSISYRQRTSVRYPSLEVKQQILPCPPRRHFRQSNVFAIRKPTQSRPAWSVTKTTTEGTTLFRLRQPHPNQSISQSDQPQPLKSLCPASASVRTRTGKAIRIYTRGVDQERRIRNRHGEGTLERMVKSLDSSRTKVTFPKMNPRT